MGRTRGELGRPNKKKSQFLRLRFEQTFMGNHLPLTNIVSMHVQSVDQVKAIKTIKRKITDLQKMTIEEQKKAVRSGYDMDIIPSDLATYGTEAKKLLQELQSRNERMFLLTFLVVNVADNRQRLGNNVFQAGSIAQKYNCQLTRLDFQQEEGFMSALPLGYKIELVVLLTAFYGLRRSEVIGLKWSAFDFNHNCFSIRHTVTTCSVKGERVTIKKDKAKNKSSLRTYPLIPFLKERLLEAKKQQEENRMLCRRAYNKEYLGYVCVDVIGNLIKPNYVSSTFGKLLAKNNLRHIRFHDLRHTCASLLLANGVPMEQVKEWLGHSEISTTVDIYGHLQYATKKQSAAAIEQDIVAPMLQNLSAVSP